jgi:carbon starvation protein CstA
MASFLICLAILIIGYFTYGKVVDNIFSPDDRETPAVAINDGVDYVVMPEWKLFLIQLLNIAGLGPIFGALTGAEWGPVVYLWITFGTIFAGGVHDYFSGMLSERNNGASISEVTGTYLGPVMKNVMRVFSVILLIMVGTVFAVGPAGLLTVLFKNGGVSADSILTKSAFWLAIILAYYFIATFASIDKIIGRIYPIFGICLIIMAIGVMFGTFRIGAGGVSLPDLEVTASDGTVTTVQMAGTAMPEIWDNFTNMHPNGTPIWSFMFISVACGAISGFHSTQSPLMARCLKSERQGHFVFYGAMVAEGIIALIWAAAGVTIFGEEGLVAVAGGNSTSVYYICQHTMGGVGIVLAMLGVIACPITSGDTAFRSARLTIADWFGIDMDDWRKRLALCIPVLGVGALLSFGNTLGFIDYSIIWRYFSWTNQTLAMIVLWAGSMYLAQNKKNYWITAAPATFMSAVSATYFCMAPECLGAIPALKNNTSVAYPVGIIVAILFLAIFLTSAKKKAAQAA